jgi:hypothetical protein
MRHLGLAALVIALLPSAAMAGERGHFGAFFGFGGRHAHVDISVPVGCAVYPDYGYAPIYVPPAVVVFSAPVYCPPPVVYAAPPVVYYAPRYYAPSGYYYVAPSRYYPR